MKNENKKPNIQGISAKSRGKCSHFQKGRYLDFLHIEKIAVVADEKWRDQLLMFLGAGRRQAPVMFFFPGEEEDARDRLLIENE